MHKKVISFILIFSFLVLFISTAKPADEIWMEIYSDEGKVGYTHRKISENKGKIKLNEQTVINLNLLGQETELRITAEYNLNNDKIQSFKYDVGSSSIGLKLKGNLEGNELTIYDLGDSSSQNYILKNNHIVPSLLPEYILGKGLKEGSSFGVYLFDPVNIFTGYSPELLKAQIKVLGRERIDTKSGSFEANKVTVIFLGAQSTIWITDNGKTVQEKFEPSLTAILSTRDGALKKRNNAFDITEKTSIASNRYIHKPRDVKMMVVKLNGLDNYDGLTLDDGNYQSFSNKVVTVNTPDIKNINSYILPYRGNRYREYLEATTLIQNNNPEIINRAIKIINNENNALLAVKLINEWTYNNIEKIPIISIPSAVDVLTNLKGDCNEHAVLFAALTRAVGIPVKVVLGVVYLDGRFYYHAWNEVYLGRWVPVDSTFGQIPSDATHLKFIEGDISKSPEILKVVGKLELEVIETQ